MAVEATPETFAALVEQGNVLVDFWGPRCQPCLALMPAVEALEESYDGRLKLVTPAGDNFAEMKKGAPYFRNAGVEHDVINANDGDYAFIEIELKQAGK